jgi:SAM-dependent methyltransferase
MKFFDGSNTRKGYTYHELPGLGIPAQRPHLKERVSFILDKVNVDKRTVLDLGCNVGGVAFLLAKAGALVDGVDYDKNSVETGNNFFKDKVTKGNVRLGVAKITPALIKQLPRYDLVFWMSQWQWFVKQHSLEAGLQALFDISSKAKTLVFESAANDGRAAIKGTTQDKIYTWLIKNTAYSEVERYRQKYHRNDRELFVCRKPVFNWGRHRNVETKRKDRNWVEQVSMAGNIMVDRKKLNKKDWPYWKIRLEIEKNMENRIRFLRELADTPIAPKLGKVGHRSIEISYEGIPIKKLAEKDIQLILKHLRKHKIVHRDIKPSDLLWNGENVVLIDYGWAVHEGEKSDCPEHIGGGYRCPTGFDDEYSLKKIKKELDESLS